MTYLITIIIWLILDQITKWFVTANFQLHQSQPVIDNILSITYKTNTGGAFGIFSSHPQLFLVLSSILAIAGLLMITQISRFSTILQFSFGSVIGGAVGNLIDRLMVGKVIDFIDFHFWPVFNVADIAICVGVFLLMIQIYREKPMHDFIFEVGQDKESEISLQNKQEQTMTPDEESIHNERSEGN
jgi:signal peptidase II